jgi:hypothetical protein
VNPRRHYQPMSLISPNPIYVFRIPPTHPQLCQNNQSYLSLCTNLLLQHHCSRKYYPSYLHPILSTSVLTPHPCVYTSPLRPNSQIPSALRVFRPRLSSFPSYQPHPPRVSSNQSVATALTRPLHCHMHQPS